jgi:hypothetical protein
MHPSVQAALRSPHAITDFVVDLRGIRRGYWVH